MGQKWLLKSEPNIWSIDQQKKYVQKVKASNYDF